MFLCVVVGCSSRFGRDKGISFFKIPTVITNRGAAERELTQKRRNGYLAAISRDKLTEKIIRNDRICSKHFISGRPAYLYDTTNPDWLPTLNLGHFKSTSKRSSTLNRVIARGGVSIETVAIHHLGGQCSCRQATCTLSQSIFLIYPLILK